MIPTNRIIILFILIALTGFNFILFGLNSPNIIGDAGHYLKIADGLADRNNNLNPEEVSFLQYREPGYPIFLVIIFGLFGANNIFAVIIAQVILLVLTAFFVYIIFELLNLKRAGFWSAMVVSLLPSYIYYSNLLLVEMLFTFLLLSSFLLVLIIALGNKNSGYYIILGVVFALLGLTRAHMLLFPVFILFILFWFKKSLHQLIICGLVFMVVITSWMGYIYTRTGEFKLTKGRQELHLYIRSVRATLSYKGQIQYLASWLKRSASGGSEDELVSQYDPWFLIREYSRLEGEGHSPAELKKDSLERLWNNRGHYILGNGVEWVKLMFIEHLFPPVSSYYNRWVRASMYVLLYSLFMFGIIGFWLKKSSLNLKGTEPMSIFIVVAGLYILYHWLVLSFFDLIPRYNTPYLVIYLITGIVGIRFLRGASK